MVSIEYEMKLEKFENDIEDEKSMDKKLKNLFFNEYDEMIGDILNLKDDLFILNFILNCSDDLLY